MYVYMHVVHVCYVCYICMYVILSLPLSLSPSLWLSLPCPPEAMGKALVAAQRVPEAGPGLVQSKSSHHHGNVVDHVPMAEHSTRWQ